MLYALINGRYPLSASETALIREWTERSAENQREKLIEDIHRSSVVAELHERIAMQETEPRSETLDEEGLDAEELVCRRHHGNSRLHKEYLRDHRRLTYGCVLHGNIGR